MRHPEIKEKVWWVSRHRIVSGNVKNIDQRTEHAFVVGYGPYDAWWVKLSDLCFSEPEAKEKLIKVLQDAVNKLNIRVAKINKRLIGLL